MLPSAEELVERFRSVYEPSKSTRRTIGPDEVRLCRELVDSAKKRVRVYSPAGFVPNRYKWPCSIQYVEANLRDGEWKFAVGWSGAQRSHAAGNLTVVQ